MTTAQILIGFGLIVLLVVVVLLVVGSQVLASRLLETLIQPIIGVLFISISATVNPQSSRYPILPTLVLVAVLVIVARPVGAAGDTMASLGPVPGPAVPATKARLR